MNSLPRNMLSLYALCLLVFVLPFFEGGRDVFGFIFALILLLPITYFLIGAEKQISFKNKYVLSLSVFIAVVALSILVAHNKYAAFYELIWWWAYLVVFVASLTLLSKDNAKKVSYALIASACVLGIAGVYFFLNDHSAYLRMGSYFSQHNAYGGFIIAPLFFACVYYFHATTRRTRIIFGSAAAFLLSNLILTFSRGSMLSVLLSILVVAPFLLKSKSLGNYGNYKSLILRALVVCVAGGAIAYGVFSVHAGSQKNIAAQASSLYQGEDENQNAITLRLRYFTDALTVIVHNPVTGVGLANYEDANTYYKNTPFAFTSDPHNVYLKILAETGLGSIAFFVFVIMLVIVLFRQLKKREVLDPVISSAILAIVALGIHNAIEIDWRYPINTVLFFLLAGVLLYESRSHSEHRTGKYGYAALFVVSGLVLWAGVYIFQSANHLEDGKYYYSKFKILEARSEYSQALHFNIFHNPEVYFAMSRVADPQKLPNDKGYINQALYYWPTNAMYYKIKAVVNIGNKDTTIREEALQKSISYDKVGDPTTYVDLGSLYLADNKDADLFKLLNQGVDVFGSYAATPMFATDIHRGQIKMSLGQIYATLSLAYKRAGNEAMASSTLDAMKKLNAQH